MRFYTCSFYPPFSSSRLQETQDEAQRKCLGRKLTEFKLRIAWLNRVINELAPEDGDSDRGES